VVAFTLPHLPGPQVFEEDRALGTANRKGAAAAADPGAEFPDGQHYFADDPRRRGVGEDCGARALGDSYHCVPGRVGVDGMRCARPGDGDAAGLVPGRGVVQAQRPGAGLDRNLAPVACPRHGLSRMGDADVHGKTQTVYRPPGDDVPDGNVHAFSGAGGDDGESPAIGRECDPIAERTDLDGPAKPAHRSGIPEHQCPIDIAGDEDAPTGAEGEAQDVVAVAADLREGIRAAGECGEQVAVSFQGRAGAHGRSGQQKRTVQVRLGERASPQPPCLRGALGCAGRTALLNRDDRGRGREQQQHQHSGKHHAQPAAGAGLPVGPVPLLA
jgi:hypothetical protein